MDRFHSVVLLTVVQYPYRECVVQLGALCKVKARDLLMGAFSFLLIKKHTVCKAAMVGTMVTLIGAI